MTTTHIFLAENGHHSWLSDHLPPNERLIQGQETLAKRNGTAGYVARAEGFSGQVKLTMVQSINSPRVPFDVAAQKYYDRNNKGGRPGNFSNRSIFHN